MWRQVDTDTGGFCKSSIRGGKGKSEFSPLNPPLLEVFAESSRIFNTAREPWLEHGDSREFPAEWLERRAP